MSRVEPRKNHILLISAFVELELYKKGYQLVLIGDDAITQKSLKSYLASLSNNESDSIKWLRKVSNADLSNFYSAAKLFVYPSLFEGFGIPPLEAVAKKVTTLCSNTTSMIDFDFLGANQFNPMDKSILKRLILSNIENGPSEEEKEKYIRIIKENYSWSKTVSIFENIFMYKL